MLESLGRSFTNWHGLIGHSQQLTNFNKKIKGESLGQVIATSLCSAMQICWLIQPWFKMKYTHCHMIRICTKKFHWSPISCNTMHHHTRWSNVRNNVAWHCCNGLTRALNITGIFLVKIFIMYSYLLCIHIYYVFMFMHSYLLCIHIYYVFIFIMYS